MKKLLIAAVLLTSVLSNATADNCQAITLENVKKCVAGRMAQGESKEAIIESMKKEIKGSEDQVCPEELAKIEAFFNEETSCQETATDVAA